jgi:hypothetical protein
VYKLGKNWQARAWHPVFKTAGSTPNAAMIRIKYLKLKYGLSLLKIHEKYKKYIFRIIFYVSLIKNDKQKKEKKLTFLDHLLALDNIYSTKSEEQEVNLVWSNLFIMFDCPSSVYTAHDHDLFRTLSK